MLNDGVMWDVRSARAVHKFDKFNMNVSGVFHPNRLEVIINTEIVSFNVVTNPKLRELVKFNTMENTGHKSKRDKRKCV